MPAGGGGRAGEDLTRLSYTAPWDWGPGELGYPAHTIWLFNYTITDMSSMNKQAREEIEALQLCQFSRLVDTPYRTRLMTRPSREWITSLQAALQTAPQIISGLVNVGAHALLAYDAVPQGDDHVFVFAGLRFTSNAVAPQDPGLYNWIFYDKGVVR